MNKPAILVLSDGSIFRGESIGIDGQAVGEVVFNTAMTGYQEILTDPSYAQQIITLTYPHVGNTGVNTDDAESNKVWASGLVIRDIPLACSSWRSKQSLRDYLVEQKVVAIAGIDTRRLTRILREKGSLNGCILSGNIIDKNQALALVANFPGLQGLDLAKVVSCKSSYEWRSSTWCLTTNSYEEKSGSQLPYHVVVYDYGVKHNILRMLVARGCSLTVVPAMTPVQQVLALNPDGVFFSNGPGDPEACDYAITTIRKLLDQNIPLFGICLGCQLLALASGAKTIKMSHGHHGANHPVQSVDTGQVMITSQNHGFAVDPKNLPDNLRITHVSLFDKTLQGIERIDKKAFAFQGHPEASPGPHDAAHLFDRFITMMINNH